MENERCKAAAICVSYLFIIYYVQICFLAGQSPLGTSYLCKLDCYLPGNPAVTRFDLLSGPAQAQIPIPL